LFTAENAEIAEMVKELNKITETVIGAAMAVHRELGPGLLESAYEACLAYELAECGLAVVVELKAQDRLEPIHKAQLLSYLKLSGCKVGLLINFNVKVLKNGIRRMVLGLKE
jgi:hypothetical protein